MNNKTKTNPNFVKLDFANLVIDKRKSLTELAEELNMRQQNLHIKAKNGHVSIRTLRYMETILGNLDKYIIRKTI